MRAVEYVFMVKEPDTSPPCTLGLVTEPGRTKDVPYIKVMLRPVSDFCPGMAWDQMETDDETVPEQEAHFEVFASLVEYLEKEGETAESTLEDMRRAVGLSQGTLHYQRERYAGLDDPWDMLRRDLSGDI